MSGLTKVEMDFCERVPYELGRIADAITKLNGVQAGTPEKEKTPPPSDCLAVTKVVVTPINGDSSLGFGLVKAVAYVALNDQLMINGLRVMEGMNGLYVGYPNDPFYKGEDIHMMYYPMTRQLREHIENCVLEKYEEATK